MTMLQCEDGQRVNVLVDLIGRAFLSGLETIDSAGELKSESRFPDLGLVMSIYLDWCVH